MKIKFAKEYRRLKGAYESVSSQYRYLLLTIIKDLLSDVLHIPLGKALDISAIVNEGYFDPIGKYTTPKDCPANFILYSFGLDKDGKLTVDGYDYNDSDHEWTFSEYDFSVSELDEILSVLEGVQEELARGLFVMNDEFRIEEDESVKDDE